MGGILILQSLLQCKQREQDKRIFDSTRAILFFGTPHQGLGVNELLSMVEDMSLAPQSRSNFVKQLKEGSNFLVTHKEEITNLWDPSSTSHSDIKIVSFYETKKTATVKKVRV
jgi:hypothetical protein